MPAIRTRTFRVLILTALPTLLPAADVRFGLQAGAAAPQGDLKAVGDFKTTASFGVHAFWHLGLGRGLRPRVDYQHFEGAHQPAALLKVNETLTSAGLDYVYHFSQLPVGFYAAAGATATQVKEEVVSDLGPRASKTETKAGWAAGLGVDGKTFGLETRYQSFRTTAGTTRDNRIASVLVTMRF